MTAFDAQGAAMTYGTIVRVKAPIEAYDATHTEVMKAAGPQEAPGFIVHIGRAVQDGFEMIEVWESKEQADAFNHDVVWPAMQRAGMPDDGPEPEVIEFDPRAVVTGENYTLDR
jgi:hypothetical protein